MSLVEEANAKFGDYLTSVQVVSWELHDRPSVVSDEGCMLEHGGPEGV
jgi:hypothetical protein